MSRRVYRYFSDFISGQEKWLNRMAEEGFRLKKCGLISYTFENCRPGEYEYAVEFAGERSYKKALDYRGFLESAGFRTFTKNINLNISFGKVKWRPYGKGAGQLATSPGSINKELLILEKKKDGRPFELHTDFQDKLNTYKTVQRVYLYSVLLLSGLAGLTFLPGGYSPNPAFNWIARLTTCSLGVLFLIPLLRYSRLIRQLKEEKGIFQ